MNKSEQILFEKRLGIAQRKGRKHRIENSPPLGFLPDGTFNQETEFKPKIIPNPEDAEIRDIDDYDDLLSD